MKYLKKIALTLAIACILAPLPAEDFVATGYGETPQQAREDALAVLAGQISTNVSTLVVTQDVDDGKAVSSRYESRSLQRSDFTPLGTEFGMPSRAGNLWEVTVTLPSSSASLYYNRLAQRAEEIDSLYDDFGQLSDLDAVSYEQIEQLSRLLSAFELDRIVAVGLDRSRASSVPELPISRSQVESRRAAKLNAEESKLEKEIDSYDVAAAFDLLTEEMEAARTALQERLDSLRSENAQRIEQMDAQTQALLEELGAMYHGAASDQTTGMESTSQLLDDVEELELRIQNLDSVHDAVSEAIKKLDSAFQEEVDSFVQENMDRPYPSVSLGADGKPTSQAVDTRRVGLHGEVVRKYAPLYAGNMNEQLEKGLGLMTDGVEGIASLARNVIDKELRLTSGDSVLSVAIESALGDAYVGTIHFTLAGQDIDLDLEIPYEAWIGEPMPDSISSYFEYEEYLFVASQWMSMLSDNAGLMRVELDASIAYDPVSYGLYLVLGSYTVTRLDNGSLVQEVDLSDKTEPVLIMSLPFDIETVFSFPFGGISADLLSSGFDYKSMASNAIEKAGLSELVDIYGLGLDSISPAVIRKLELMPLEARLANPQSSLAEKVDSLMDEEESAKAAAQNAKESAERKRQKATVMDTVLQDSMLLIEPYISGGGAFAIGTSPGCSRVRGLFSLGLATYYNPSSSDMDMYVGLTADFLYAYTKSSSDVAGGTLEEIMHAIGGSFGFDVMFALPLDSFALKLQASIGVGWYPGTEFIVGWTAGALIPSGNGLLDISASVQLSMPYDFSASGFHDDTNLSIGLVAGYVFDVM